MMYICKTCGEVFEEPRIIYEPHSYGEGSAYERWAVCPHCDSEMIEEAAYCAVHDEFVPLDDMQTGFCCKSCVAENLTEQTAWEFLKETKQEAGFLIDYFLNVSRCYTLDEARRLFNAQSEEERMDDLRYYIDKDEFGEWMEGKHAE